MIDFNALPAQYIEKYGRDKVAEVLEVGIGTIGLWDKGNKYPISALQKLLEFDPAPLGQITPLYTNPEPGTKLAVLVPLSGPPAAKMMDSLIRLYDRKEMGYQRIAFNCLSVSRNALAAWFLNGPYEWAFWMDGDSLVPAGDAEWFKREAEMPDMPDLFAEVHTIFRLLVHRKSIMSCCYVGRKMGAAPQFGGGDSPEMRQLVRRGPRDMVKEVPWVGFGGVLTHRKVFEDIIATQGDSIRMKPNGIGARFNYEYGFFDPLDRETPGDDIPLCQRAAQAGHKCHVDFAVMGAHIGDRAFTYKNL